MSKRKRPHNISGLTPKNEFLSNSDFITSAQYNDDLYLQYLMKLTEYALSMFEWKNLPPTVDERYLELNLFNRGAAIFFEDDELGFLCLPVIMGGAYDVYGIPINRTAYANNGYHKDLDKDNSVIIYNNMLHTNSVLDVQNFSRKLYDIDRTIEINIKAQKTPVLITCDETQRLTMKNLYAKYEGNAPVIFAEKSIQPNTVKVLNTGAPLVATSLTELKSMIWNEALTYLGISNTNFIKRERMISDEVVRNQGGTIASRYSRLEMRRKAAKEINEMFGLDIQCDFREDFQDMDIGNETLNQPETDMEAEDSDNE